MERSFLRIMAVIFMTLAPTAAWAYVAPPECAADRIAAYESLDTDGDGLTDAQESCTYFTDPASVDTDSDGHPDGEEAAEGYSPRHAEKRLVDVDSDEDYLNDAWELLIGTTLMDPDSDGDLYLDGTEVAAAYDPLDRAPTRVEKRIEVRHADLRLAYFFGDALLDEIPVSTGKPATPTPRGDFTVLDKIPVKRYLGPTWDYPGTKWNLWFTSRNGWRYYIHGAYWHDKFGVSPVSGGCVNVRYADMERLYWFAQHGTKVHVE